MFLKLFARITLALIKIDEPTIEQRYDRVQEKLQQQELALLKQQLPVSQRKPAKKQWTQDELTAWRDNYRRVDEMHRNRIVA